MCSKFVEKMDNYQGDLGDIFRAGGGGVGLVNGSSTNTGDISEWQFHNDPSGGIANFGHPFGDPLLEDLDMCSGGNSSFFSSSILEDGNGFDLDEEMIKRPPTPPPPPNTSSNIFSRLLQISPNANKLPCDSQSSASLLLPNNDLMSSTNNTSSMVENTALQIPSPRNTGVIKRRKSQAKKVVCIPAPAPVNSRPTGEVVPSDLWAWRKYGQKPIKGSPYPRGYYRCSSSKGCSARKQVERSRTDPNMLVITYTSEHNHPWPTQRNALAGSTRATGSLQPKNTSTSTSSTTKNSPSKQVFMKDEPMESSITNNTTSPSVAPLTVKEEKQEGKNERFPQSYCPALPDASHHMEDFFAELGEIESTDPLSILFNHGLGPSEEGRDNDDKSLDPFSFYDWPSAKSTSTNPSLGEAKRGL